MFTWFLEVAPAIIVASVLIFTHKSFPLTTLAYILILIHCIILMIGGHYTYAHVPLFDSLSELVGSSRNNYDKLGHFMQGFVPALVIREVIIRKNIISLARWRSFFIVATCLGLSAFYELVEWWVAILTGENAQAFLGTQGYIWDTQSDMAFALIGAVASLVLLSSLHDKELSRLGIDI